MQRVKTRRSNPNTFQGSDENRLSKMSSSFAPRFEVE